jgi:hypothetical protein
VVFTRRNAKVLGAQEEPSGLQRFVDAPPPTDVEVARLLASVGRRTVRLVGRHGIELAGGLGDGEITDSFAFDSRVLAENQGAWVSRRG